MVTLEVTDGDLTPLHEGTTATIRATSLSGIANRYVSLQPGPNDASEIDDGGLIDADDTAAPVDLDVLFNSLDAKTRKGLMNVVRGSARRARRPRPGRGREHRVLRCALPVEHGAPDGGAGARPAAAERFISDGATTVSAIAERRDDLAELVGNTNVAFRAIADENVSLEQALELLPDTLRSANTTFVNLRATLDDLELLVDESIPPPRSWRPSSASCARSWPTPARRSRI